LGNAGNHAAARLLIGGGVAAAMTVGTLAAPALARSAGWESILGGHLTSKAAAIRIADEARAKGFNVYVQKISSTNWEVEIFNGGASKSEAVAVCAKATRRRLPHCSVEQEYHGDGWTRGAR
jgi:broad specificity polyphosphatase/5'/3'-nucleotidase SurE